MNCALSINQLRALSTKLDIEESNSFDSILSTFIIYMKLRASDWLKTSAFVV